MNIEDIKETGDMPKSKMYAIFEKQKELMREYQQIEGLPDWPLNVDISENQKILKDFKQRGFEELAEAIEAKTNNEENHFKEELIDALHFFVELHILVGKSHVEYQNVRVPYKKSLLKCVGGLCKHYGLAMNCLKNKPWKQSQVRTDKIKFHEYLEKAFGYFISMLNNFDMDMEEIYRYYFKKHEVNKFRINTKY